MDAGCIRQRVRSLRVAGERCVAAQCGHGTRFAWELGRDARPAAALPIAGPVPRGRLLSVVVAWGAGGRAGGVSGSCHCLGSCRLGVGGVLSYKTFTNTHLRTYVLEL